jgi:hypothetical protein
VNVSPGSQWGPETRLGVFASQVSRREKALVRHLLPRSVELSTVLGAMAHAVGNDDELAALIRQALAVITVTDSAPNTADEGEGEGGSGGPDRGRPKSWSQWKAFSDRVETGKAFLTVAVDFKYTDGGRLEGDKAQMERMYCYHDPTKTDDSTMLDVVHAHTTTLWKDRRKLAEGRPLRCFTSVNARYARRSCVTSHFVQDSTKNLLVPKSPVLKQQWRSLPEEYLVWDLDNNSVPPLDMAFAADYQSVRKVLKAGEAFCQESKLAFSQAQSNALIRGTAMRDGYEVEYEVVAISRKSGDEDPAAWQNLRAAVLCIGIGKYQVLGCLPNAVRDAQALCNKVNALPDCRAKLLKDLHDRKAIRIGIRQFLKDLQKAPPGTVLVNYSGHGMQRGGTVYLLPGDADLSETTCEPDNDFLPIQEILKWCREDLDMLARMLNPPRQVTFVLVVDACRVAEMDYATLPSSLEPPSGSAPGTWALCFSCSRDSTASDGPQGAHSPFAQELLDEKAGIFAPGVPLRGGLDQACKRMCQQHPGQHPVPLLHSIQEGWCFYETDKPLLARPVETAPPESPGPHKSVVATKLLHPEAQSFWEETFPGEVSVTWAELLAAFKEDFADVIEGIDNVKYASGLSHLRKKIDVNEDNTITFKHFNIFTKKNGVRGALQNFCESLKQNPDASVAAAVTCKNDVQASSELLPPSIPQRHNETALIDLSDVEPQETGAGAKLETLNSKH